MKIMILKIALTIYNKQWKKEASFYSKKMLWMSENSDKGT